MKPAMTTSTMSATTTIGQRRRARPAAPTTVPAAASPRRRDPARLAGATASLVGGDRRGVPGGGRVRVGHTRIGERRCCHGCGRDRRAEARDGAASSWRATGGTPAWRAGVSAIPTRRCRRPRWARWPASARSRPTTSPGRWLTVPVAAAPACRRRRTGGAGPGSRSALPTAVTAALDDPDPLVVVGAAWFLGERASPAGACRRSPRPPRATTTPAAARPPWPRSGAIGDPAGLPAVLAALERQADGAASGDGGAGRLRRPAGRAGPAGGGRGPGLAGAPGRRGAARRRHRTLAAPGVARV